MKGSDHMFDMRMIGKKIADLRKEKNMTQLELADLLGISYQAVSHWERGESMPDISKLSDLSEILEVSIDTLLGNHKDAKAIREIMDHDKIDLSKHTQETLENVLPLMKPKQVNESTKEQTTVSMETIAMMAPFLDSSLLAELVLSSDVTGLESEVVKLAPFLDTDDLSKIVNLIIEKNPKINVASLLGLAPFLSDKALDDLSAHIEDTGEYAHLIGLAPFLSEESLSKLALKWLEKDPDSPMSKWTGLAPFLEQKTLDTIALTVYEKQGGSHISGLAPFLSTETIDQIIVKAVASNQTKDIMSLMPFSGNSFKDFITANFKK